MVELGILADDLTGALDAAAPFASPDASVKVVWTGEDLGKRFSICTSTRDGRPGRAAYLVGQNLRRVAGAKIAFKKIDSLLRGNTAVELAACARSGLFRSIMISPAFPSQGRIVKEGRLLANGHLESSPVPLGARLENAGIRTCSVNPFDDWPDDEVLLCDAATDSDLDAIAERGRKLVAPVLWCGSAGLARALAPRRNGAKNRRSPRLIVIGSRHAVSREHFDQLAASTNVDCIRIQDPSDPLGRGVSPEFPGKRTGVLGFLLPELPSASVSGVYREVFARLAKSIRRPGCVMVCGGDTARWMMKALGTRTLSVIGDWSEGIPLSRIEGGRWDGTLLYSKSGAFHDCRMFEHLLAGSECREE